MKIINENNKKLSPLLVILTNTNTEECYLLCVQLPNTDMLRFLKYSHQNVTGQQKAK